MEADNPVNEANPHISNIGKMVEVRLWLVMCEKVFIFHTAFSFSGNGKQNEKLFE